MRKTTFFLMAILCLLSKPTYLFSQTSPVRCNTTEHTKMLQKQHPEMFKNQERIEEHTQRVLKQTNPLQKIEGIITIPVVVHIVYNTSEQNISDAQILSQIEVLNEDFRRLNPDASDTPADFLPVAADTEIEFCLASYDSNGNPTTGITRKVSTVTLWDENSLKFSNQGGVDAWPTGDYLNIWVANIPYLGDSQFPGGPADTDGIVCLYNAFGRVGVLFPEYNLGRTAAHEVGHWLNLRHIWGDGDCSVDDLVSDTPNAAFPNFTGSPCTHGAINSCDEGEGDLPDMFQNYMDHSRDACNNIFTIGQKDRMRALFEPGGARESLLNSTACTPLPDYCSNELQDNDETGVDCGGSCIPCISCTDGIQNGEEGDVDCGGATCGSCSGCSDPAAHNYSPATEIEDGSCETCTDDLQNGDETGVDCGGVLCMPCREDALDIACGDILTGSSNSNSSRDFPILCEDLLTTYSNDGVWFSFIGPGDKVFLSTDNEGTSSSFSLQVFVEEDGDIACVGSDSYGGLTYFTAKLDFVSESGATYYVYVSDIFLSQGDFVLSMECLNNVAAPININHNRVCDVPSEGQSQVTVVITGGTAPYQVSGNFNGEVEENGSFIFIMGDNESTYEINVVDAAGNESQILENVLPCTKLPVELLSFGGEVMKEGNLLQWTTASELNNQFFSLSYSTDGYDFLPLQKMAGNGTTSSANRYNFMHRTAPNGIVYYQLSQTDLDETTKDLGVISLQRGESRLLSSIEVYPTATKHQLNVSYEFVNDSKSTTLNIYDMTGRVVKSQTLNASSTSIQLDVSMLSTGTYFLQLNDGLETLTAKFIRF